MNNSIIKEAKDNYDNSKQYANDELSKKIMVKVDKGLLSEQKRISHELIEIGYNDLYIILESTLKETIKYIKRVNLKRPFKQNALSKFLGFSLEADYLSSSTWLYTNLLSMVQILPFFEALFNKLDEIEKDFRNMISTNSLSDTTVYNKTALLAQMEGLKQLKLSLLSLYNCYSCILKNAEIKEFFTRWIEYKKIQLCKINRNHYQEMLDFNELLVDRINRL